MFIRLQMQIAFHTNFKVENVGYLIIFTAALPCVRVMSLRILCSLFENVNTCMLY